jgi:hypothetical protein
MLYVCRPHVIGTFAHQPGCKRHGTFGKDCMHLNLEYEFTLLYWVTVVAQSGDGRSSMGDGRSSVGDGRSSMGDGRSSMGDGHSSVGDSRSSIG